MSAGAIVSAPVSVRRRRDRSESELPIRVSSALRNSPYRALHAVQADVQAGTVRLHGQVRSFYEKQLAQIAVMQVEGVRHLRNEVEVQ